MVTLSPVYHPMPIILSFMLVRKTGINNRQMQESRIEVDQHLSNEKDDPRDPRQANKLSL